MKTPRRLLVWTIIAFGCMFSNQAFSQGWTEPMSITMVHTGHASTNFYLYTTGPSSLVPQCPANTVWQFRSGDGTQDRQKRTYAALLLAFTTSKRVSLFTTGCADGMQTFDAILIYNP